MLILVVCTAAPSADEIDRACLTALCYTDSFKVKTRLKRSRDELLPESFKWILYDAQYCRWRDHEDLSLLWIKGDAGKGKTMMSIGLIEELLQCKKSKSAVTYFFCQRGDTSLNTVESVVKGLIFRLFERQESVRRTLRKRWNVQQSCFENDIHRLENLWDIFLEMLSECQSIYDSIFVVIDALDECLATGLTDFLELLVRTGLYSPKQVKWLLTSRPLREAEQYLIASANRVHVSLEINARRVTQGIRIYIEEQVRKLAIEKNYDLSTQHAMTELMHARANGTFLWVSFVCEELQLASTRDVTSIISSLPQGLHDVYAQAYTRYCSDDHRNGAQRAQMLRTLILAYRPLSIFELAAMLTVLNEEVGVRQLVHECSFFIRIRDDEGIQYVEFVHQSARDYLEGLSNYSYPDLGVSFSHETMALRCLSVLTDMVANPFRSSDPSATGEEIAKAGGNQMARFAYPAVFWASHLLSLPDDEDLRAKSSSIVAVDSFLRHCLLEWLEYLSLMQQLSRASEVLDTLLLALSRPEHTANPTSQSYSGAYTIGLIQGCLGSSQEVLSLLTLVQDARRFLRRFYQTVSEWPLQVYSSAVIYSPEASTVKAEYIRRAPRWLRQLPQMEVNWSCLQQTIGILPFWPESIVFSPDGQLIACGDRGCDVKIYTVRTGQKQQTLKAHSRSVETVAFSPDGQLIASGSVDKTAKVFVVKTGQIQQTFTGHLSYVTSVGFSPDGRLIASGSKDCAVKVWVVKTGQVEQTFTGHSGGVRSVAFSPDGRIVASGSEDNTIKLWNVNTGQIQRTIRGHSNGVASVVFSVDGQLIASGSSDTNIKIWDPKTGENKQVFTVQRPITSVAFPPGGQLVASGSSDNTINLWEVKTGKIRQTYIGHSSIITSVVFSPDGQSIASASLDGSIKIWDVKLDEVQHITKSHSHAVRSVVLSPDRRLGVSTSEEGTITLWDVKTSRIQQTPVGYLKEITSIAFSTDGKLVALGSHDKTIKVWTVETGEVLTLNGHTDCVKLIAFSPDGQKVVSGSYDRIVKVWDLKTGHVQTFKGHPQWVESVSFSPDGQMVVSGGIDGTIKVWTLTTGKAQTFKIHSQRVKSISLSPCGRLLLLEGIDKVTVWDMCNFEKSGNILQRSLQYIRRPAAVQTLRFPRRVHETRFAPDGTQFIVNGTCYSVAIGQPSSIVISEMHDVHQLHVKDDWVAYGPRRLLRMPPDYKAKCYSSRDNHLIIGTSDGQVLIFEIDCEAINSLWSLCT